MLISGNEAISLGVIAAGCKFMAAYPMTPSTGIITYLADKARQFGLVAEQAEDEIAAINMAIGASFAGVMLAATAFSLLIPAIELGGIWTAVLGTVIGGLFLHLVDRFTPHLHFISGPEGPSSNLRGI